MQRRDQICLIVPYPIFLLQFRNSIELLDTYELKKQIVTAYVMDEGSNLNTMTVALKLIINCDVFCLEEFF